MMGSPTSIVPTTASRVPAGLTMALGDIEIRLDENNQILETSHIVESGTADPTARGIPTHGAPIRIHVPERVPLDPPPPPATSSRLHFMKFIRPAGGGPTLKRWECGLCGKDFKHQSYLIRHLPLHSDEKAFMCELCDKAFALSSSLCQHQATHSDLRPYACDVCGKTFARGSTLAAHQKTHSLEKQYKCGQCDMAFHQKTNLDHHQYVHTGRRPYQCPECPKTFNQLSNLTSHRHAQHERGLMV